jgi:hypothetical protein
MFLSMFNVSCLVNEFILDVLSITNLELFNSNTPYSQYCFLFSSSSFQFCELFLIVVNVRFNLTFRLGIYFYMPNHVCDIFNLFLVYKVNLMHMSLYK